MRRILFFIIILTGMGLFVVSCKQETSLPQTDAEIYLVDARLNRLLPYSDKIVDADAELMAQDALDKLVEGRDANKNIRRVIPNIKDCLSVHVKDNVAYVDISSDVRTEMQYSRDIEKLFIYQIVNTITSIKGIRFVRFTIDGDIHKDFLGFYDMRDIYKFKYPE